MEYKEILKWSPERVSELVKKRRIYSLGRYTPAPDPRPYYKDWLVRTLSYKQDLANLLSNPPIRGNTKEDKLIEPLRYQISAKGHEYKWQLV